MPLHPCLFPDFFGVSGGSFFQFLFSLLHRSNLIVVLFPFLGTVPFLYPSYFSLSLVGRQRQAFPLFFLLFFFSFFFFYRTLYNVRRLLSADFAFSALGFLLRPRYSGKPLRNFHGSALLSLSRERPAFLTAEIEKY